MKGMFVMRLCEKLLRDPTLAPLHQVLLQRAQRIVADDVAEYYYMGTDQEYWRIATDFPNLAPPFELSFLECRAPQAIVSRECGTKLWTPEMGYEWGHLCQAVSRAQRLEALEWEQGRQLLYREVQEDLERLLPTLHDWQEGRLSFPPQPAGTREELAFAPDLLAVQVEDLRQRLAWMQQGQWDQVQQQLASDPWEWTLDLLTFVNFSRSGRDRLAPCWWTRLRVLPEGRVQTNEQGAAIWEDEPLGAINRLLHAARLQVPSEYASLLHQARLSLAPFLHTALLTISFLHCRNVTLQEVRPPGKPLTNQQRRRGERPRAPLSYHVLDIRPMREVLRSQGQESQVGSRKALHICRGHFAHYGERGLFGKYQGTFWRPQHVRGSAERGVQQKDYRISLPTPPAPSSSSLERTEDA